MTQVAALRRIRALFAEADLVADPARVRRHLRLQRENARLARSAKGKHGRRETARERRAWRRWKRRQYELVAALTRQRTWQDAEWAARLAAPCSVCSHPIGEHVERAGGRLRPGVGGNAADYRQECSVCACTLWYRQHPW